MHGHHDHRAPGGDRRVQVSGGAPSHGELGFMRGQISLTDNRHYTSWALLPPPSLCELCSRKPPLIPIRCLAAHACALARPSGRWTSATPAPARPRLPAVDPRTPRPAAPLAPRPLLPREAPTSPASCPARCARRRGGSVDSSDLRGGEKYEYWSKPRICRDASYHLSVFDQCRSSPLNALPTVPEGGKERNAASPPLSSPSPRHLRAPLHTALI